MALPCEVSTRSYGTPYALLLGRMAVGSVSIRKSKGFAAASSTKPLLAESAGDLGLCCCGPAADEGSVVETPVEQQPGLVRATITVRSKGATYCLQPHVAASNVGQDMPSGLAWHTWEILL